MPKVSVIIPCFNLGRFLTEALESVLNQTFQDFEIIVVNDGSTEEATNKIINELNNPKIKVIQTSNQGLSCARNNGINQSGGEYILALDADDKIHPHYLEKAVVTLDKNYNLGIVYCEAMFFGEEQGKWELPEYDFPQILLHNLIFCCSFFRKADWEKVGGYNPNMIYGWEDYDFWLCIIELKREVYRIPEVLFYYRRRSDSMSNKMLKEHKIYSYQTMFKNHRDLYFGNIDGIFEHICSLNEDRKQLREVISKLKRHKLVLQAEIFKWHTLAFYLLKFCIKKTGGLVPIPENRVLSFLKTNNKIDQTESKEN